MPYSFFLKKLSFEVEKNSPGITQLTIQGYGVQHNLLFPGRSSFELLLGLVLPVFVAWCGREGCIPPSSLWRNVVDV